MSTESSSTAADKPSSTATVPGRKTTTTGQPPPRTAGRGLRFRLAITIGQTAIVCAFLAVWQWADKVPVLRGFSFTSSFFISRPTLVAREIADLVTGSNGVPLVWQPFLNTLESAIVGTVAAIVVGSLGGLLLSNSAVLEHLARPFLFFLNSVPRVAVVPVFVLVVANASQADALTAFTVVVFLVFFNAFEGGISVPLELIQNARILGAGPMGIMWRVRWPEVLAWTFASLPNAISFGLVGSVTAELFTGSVGVGQLLTAAVDTSNATLTFALVFILTVAGVILVVAANVLRKRVLRWRPESA
jgi:NitT/TauT family transport system permease protein